jgi:hypothetical protein
MSFLALIASIIIGSLAALTCLCLLAERIALSIRTTARSTRTSYSRRNVYSDCEKGAFLATSEKEIQSSTFLQTPAVLVETSTYDADRLEMVGIAPEELMVQEQFATEDEHVVEDEVLVDVGPQPCSVVLSPFKNVKRSSVQDMNEFFVDEGSMQVKGVRDVRGDRDVDVSGLGVGVTGVTGVA